MVWQLNKDRALCPQICEQLCVGIASGEFSSGDKLMSVRDAAVSAGVNPNTMQRAFEQLERDGILYSVRGSGWYVGDDTEKAKEVLNRIIREKTEVYFNEMISLGLTTDEVIQYVKEWNV